jgi:hypothetical protein
MRKDPTRFYLTATIFREGPFQSFHQSQGSYNSKGYQRLYFERKASTVQLKTVDYTTPPDAKSLMRSNLFWIIVVQNVNCDYLIKWCHEHPLARRTTFSMFILPKAIRSISFTYTHNLIRSLPQNVFSLGRECSEEFQYYIVITNKSVIFCPLHIFFLTTQILLRAPCLSTWLPHHIVKKKQVAELLADCTNMNSRYVSYYRRISSWDSCALP